VTSGRIGDNLQKKLLLFSASFFCAFCVSLQILPTEMDDQRLARLGMTGYFASWIMS